VQRGLCQDESFGFGHACFECVLSERVLLYIWPPIVPERIDMPLIIVRVKDGESLDRALRRYKKKYEKLGIMKESRRRMYHTRPSIMRRMEIKKATRRDAWLREHGILQ
jgi:small subunit ribosomal protein S21